MYGGSLEGDVGFVVVLPAFWFMRVRTSIGDTINMRDGPIETSNGISDPTMARDPTGINVVIMSHVPQWQHMLL